MTSTLTKSLYIALLLLALRGTEVTSAPLEHDILKVMVQKEVEVLFKDHPSDFKQVSTQIARALFSSLVEPNILNIDGSQANLTDVNNMRALSTAQITVAVNNINSPSAKTAFKDALEKPQNGTIGILPVSTCGFDKDKLDHWRALYTYTIFEIDQKSSIQNPPIDYQQLLAASKIVTPAHLNISVGSPTVPSANSVATNRSSMAAKIRLAAAVNDLDQDDLKVEQRLRHILSNELVNGVNSLPALDPKFQVGGSLPMTSQQAVIEAIAEAIQTANASGNPSNYPSEIINETKNIITNKHAGIIKNYPTFGTNINSTNIKDYWFAYLDKFAPVAITLSKPATEDEWNKCFLALAIAINKSTKNPANAQRLSNQTSGNQSVNRGSGSSSGSGYVSLLGVHRAKKIARLKERYSYRAAKISVIRGN